MARNVSSVAIRRRTQADLARVAKEAARAARVEEQRIRIERQLRHDRKIALAPAHPVFTEAVKAPARVVARVIWELIGYQFQFVPFNATSKPRIVDIRDRVAGYRSWFLLHEIACELWQGRLSEQFNKLAAHERAELWESLSKVGVMVEDRSKIVTDMFGAPETPATVPAFVEHVKPRAGDSIAVTLIGKPFPKRLWVISEARPDGVVVCKGGSFLPNGTGVDVEATFTHPPGPAHAAEALRSKTYLTAWVGLASLETLLSSAIEPPEDETDCDTHEMRLWRMIDVLADHQFFSQDESGWPSENEIRLALEGVGKLKTLLEREQPVALEVSDRLLTSLCEASVHVRYRPKGASK